MSKLLLYAVPIAALTLITPPGWGQALDPGQIGKAAPDQSGVPELLGRARNALAEENHELFRETIRRLHELRPNNSEYMYQLVLAHALLNEKRQAYDVMLKMQRQGLAYDFNQTEASRNLRKTQLYDYLNDLMVDAGKPFGSVEEMATLGPEITRPESIGWDSGRKAFLVGTVSDGTVLSLSADGTTQELLKADSSNGMWGIYGIAVDPERNRLWVASAATEDFSGFDPVDVGRSALFEFALDSMELIKRYPVPVDGLPHRLRNLTVAPNGDIFLADGLFPFVYRKKADENKLTGFIAFKQMVSLRGLDVSGDGKFLFVADYEMGIAVIDLVNATTWMLGAPETLNLGGIVGLNYWNGRLLAIQSGISPQRIMVLELDPSGRGVAKATPIIAALDVLEFPSYGTVVDDDLVFFANSHWSPKGTERKPVTVARASLTKLPDTINYEAEKFVREYRANKARNTAAKAEQKLSESEEEQKKQKDP